MLVIAALAASQAAPPTPEYLAIIERYRQGDRAVLRELWSLDLRNELSGVKRLVRTAAGCTECDERPRAQEFPFEAAAMLLTERDIDDSKSRSAGEEVASRPAPLLDFARQTIELIPDADRRRGFERPWFLAVSMHLFQHGQWPLAEHYMELGLRLYPNDGELLLLRGSILETLSATAEDDAPRGTAFQPGRERRRLLAQAEEYYRRALAADPSLDEARTRLGRVLALRGRREQAGAELKAVIAAPGAAVRARYLALLFLGRLREAEDEPRAAEAAYEAAIALEPKAQAAYIALSHARHRAGEWAESIVPLRTVMGLAGSRSEWDPWWAYTWGQSYDGERLLEALRRAAPQ